MLRRAKDTLSMFFSSNPYFLTKLTKTDMEPFPCMVFLNLYSFLKPILIYWKTTLLRQSLRTYVDKSEDEKGWVSFSWGK